MAKWVLDRYDEELAGLGLAVLAEDEETTAARLLGDSLARARPWSAERLHLGVTVLYEAVRDNLHAVGIVPDATSADEKRPDRFEARPMCRRFPGASSSRGMCRTCGLS